MTAMPAECLQQPDLEALVATATAEVAPSWPLDRSIAVNPWWQQRDRSVQDVAAEQQAWFGIPMLMPATPAGEAVPEWAGSVAAVQDVNLRQKGARALPWLTEIKQQMSQFCALWASYPEQVAQDQNINERMYKQWLTITRQDRGIQLLLNNKNVKRQLQALPTDYQALYQQALQLPLDEAQWSVYLQVLLHDIYGWASVFAQRRWQRELEQQPRFNDELTQLLTIRLAWDLVCWHSVSTETRQQFERQWAAYEQVKAEVKQQQAPLWQRQQHCEWRYQQQLAAQLQRPCDTRSERPEMQAVLCIDVRSEPMRRALEAQSESIQTLGFAGFFGLPVEYQISPGYSKPQLPGLLAPQWQVCQPDDAESQRKHIETWRSASWHRAHESPAGAYGWVEMSGLTKAWKLLKRSLTYKPQRRVASPGMNQQAWQISRAGQPASAAELAQLAANALKGMGLTANFAPHVLLVGHSASTRNNPHAASLECGACGGQSGSANAQVLAQILNQNEVRAVLSEQHGITVPASTEFLPGLHDTTQQQLNLLSPCSDDKLQGWLEKANTQAQREQLQRLSPGSHKDDQQTCSVQLQKRAGSWAEVRPEWGLARNAAIIFAPRAATRNCHFDARAFLHDYHAEQDPEQQILTQLMTAPMVVAHWINMQYYASTVAPQQFGSGNKLLHNVVADGLGVFEGNGGDIRIGLSRQSLHDGENWYHEPLRLTVVIAASQTAIDRVISEQPVVRQLIDNEWLYLWQWQPEQQHQPQQRSAKGWQPVEDSPQAMNSKREERA
ncbi:DUF2309 domain-containing protein [Pseudidiomarina sp. 1APP75-27a]|uniref:putative inorganic carbon transporter subunit DabA n=1 Tax=Pseudidiomarina terrestris TaxID=2820060 RepID=UPI002B05D480|nr:putative inorganic carbon transporter subunit DabA [Pseudidiomarina sp. 1APP75-27a]MEA3586879.1 DUF2309 domain-containing protein [Pseudidiomarina sp. 1APP75-27a]